MPTVYQREILEKTLLCNEQHIETVLFKMWLHGQICSLRNDNRYNIRRLLLKLPYEILWLCLFKLLMIMCLIMLISLLKFTIRLIITQNLTFSWCDVPWGMMFFLSFLRESAEDSSPPFLVFSFVRFATSPLESLTQAISENQMYTKVTMDSHINFLL